MRKQDTKPISNTVEKRRAESVKTTSLLGTFCSWMIVLVSLFAGSLQPNDLRYATFTAVGTIIAICLTIASILAHRNKLNLAIWLSIVAIEIMFILISFAVANLGIILAIVLLIIIGSLILQSLSSKAAIMGIITGIIASIATLFIDIFSINHLHIIPPSWLVEIAIIASGIIVLILGVELLRHYQFNRIRSQIIVAFIIISVVPLWTIAVLQLVALRSLLQENAYESILESAGDVAKDFDNTLIHLKDNNASDAELPIFIKFIQGGGVVTSQDIFEYFQVMKKHNSNILSYSLLDKSGKVLVETRPTQVDTNQKVAIDFQNTVENRISSISDISFDISINKHVFYIHSPILNNNNISGILRVEINADLFQEELVKQAVVQGNDITAILVDQNGVILANSSSEETRFKLIAPLTQDLLAALQKQHMLASGTSDDLTLGLLDLNNNLNKNDQNSAFQATLNPNNGEINALAYRNTTTNKSWKIIVGRPVSWFTEPVNTQIRITILIGTILMLAALTVAIIASNRLTSPLNYLTAMAERILRGELDFSVTLERHDEIGRLSKILNAITLELKEILANIENRIDERIEDLAATTKSTKQQADQLRSIIEVTHTITSIQNSRELLLEITRKISIEFGFYHVGIFLTDQTGQYTILQAANSDGGQKMLEKGYRLRVGQSDGVGSVTSSGKPYFAMDSGNKAVVFNNPDLPNTHSEIVIPLQIGENIIGALDLQSDKNTVFSKDNIDSFNLLANQISIVIQNARLFEETRSALAEAQVFYRQSATASWRDVLHQGTRGYRYLNGSIEPIKENAQNIEKKNTENDVESLIIPINIRGKSLGTLNIHQVGRNHSWSNSEIRVYQSIVDRISFALENARLYQDAQRRASKERVISEIATKVSSSVNMDNILQTAVEELGRVLPGSEIIIQFEHEDETSAEFRAQD